MRRNDRNVSEILLIEEIIRKADVCRIAMANDNIPYMVTMNFGYTGGTEKKLFFHCAAEGRKLDMIRQNSYVCFEMDTDHQIFKGTIGCDWGMKFSSIIGYGNISVLTGAEDREEGLKCIMKHYTGEMEHTFDEKVLERTTILCLRITEMTGKKC